MSNQAEEPIRVLRREYNDGTHEPDVFDQLGPARLSLEERERLEDQAYQDQTSFQKFVGHLNFCLWLLGFSVLLGAVTGMVHLSRIAYVVMIAVYLITLYFAMKR